MNRQSTKVIFGVLIVAALVVLLWSGVATEDTTPTSLVNDGPDSQILGASVTSYDSSGQVNYELEAASISYYESTGLYTIELPMIAYMSPTGEEWRLTAETALVDADESTGPSTGRSVFYLQGNVSIDGPQSNFRTTSLVYTPSTDMVKAVDEVSIEHAGSSVAAHGLEINLSTGSYILNTEDEAKSQMQLQVPGTGSK